MRAGSVCGIPVLLLMGASVSPSATSNVTFTTTGQSIWQPGPGGGYQDRFFTGTSWNKDVYVPFPAPGVFVDFSGNTSGYIGVETGFIATAGQVNASVPFRIDVDPSLAADGKSVLLSSSFASLGTPSYTSYSPQVQAYVDLLFAANFYADWRVAPLFGDDYQGYYPFRTGDLRIPLVSVNRDGDQSLKLFGQTIGVNASAPVEVKLRALGAYEVGSVSANVFPYIQTSEANPHGNADLLSLDVDLIAALQAGAASVGLFTPPLSLSLGDGFSMSLVAATAGVVLGLDEVTNVYGGRPTVNVTLNQTGQTWSFPAGDSYVIEIPDSVEDPAFSTFYTLEGANTARFSNQLGFTINPRLGVSFGNINYSGVFNFSLYETTTPNFVPPIHLPLIDFGLQGFSRVAGPGFQFDREGSETDAVTDTPEPSSWLVLSAAMLTGVCVRQLRGERGNCMRGEHRPSGSA